MKMDELQSILATEIKSRIQSEETLRKQILRTHSNQHSDDNGSSGAGVMVTSRLDALTDQIRSMEEEIASEKISISSLREKLSVLADSLRQDTETHLKDMMTDIDNSVSLQHSAKEERKVLFESVRQLERSLAEQRDGLAGMDKEISDLQTNTQRDMDNISSKLTEEIRMMRHMFDTTISELQGGLEEEGQARVQATRGVQDDLRDIHNKLRHMDEMWQERLEDGLRVAYADLKSAKESNTACVQELREVLSAEITSRRKAAGKITSSMHTLTETTDKNTSDLHALAGEVDERFSLLDANLCKVTSSFSEQIGTLKTATRSAVRTLQMEQKSLLSRVEDMERENKRYHAVMMEEIKKASERQERMEAAFNDRLKALDKVMEGVVASTEARCGRIERSLAEEVEHRQQAVQHVTDLLASTVQKISAKIEETSVEMSYKVTIEEQTRVHMLSVLEKRLLDAISRDRAASSRDMKAAQEQMASDLQYAVTTEAQARAEGISQLESMLRDVQKESSRAVLGCREEMKNAISYAASLEAQTRACSINGVEGRMREALRVRLLDITGDIQNVENRLTDQGKVFAASVAGVEDRISANVKEQYDGLSGNIRHIDSRVQEEKSMQESLVSMNATLDKKLSDTRSDVSTTRKDVDELRHTVETFKVSWTKECVEQQERIQALQSQIESLEGTGSNKEAAGEASESEGNGKALVEVNKVKSAVKELAASWKTELQESREAMRNMELQLSKCCTHEDLDHLEVRYIADRLVADVLQRCESTDTSSGQVTGNPPHVASVQASLRALTLSCEEKFSTTAKRLGDLEEGVEDIRRGLQQVGGDIKQYTDTAVTDLTSYVDESVMDVRTKEVVSSTLGFIVDNIVESDLIASIDNGFDNMRLELNLEVLEHIQKVLSEPLDDLQNRQSVMEDKLGKYDIAYIQKKLRDFERDLEEANDEVEKLKTDVIDDLKERILKVVAAVETLSR